MNSDFEQLSPHAAAARQDGVVRSFVRLQQECADLRQHFMPLEFIAKPAATAGAIDSTKKTNATRAGTHLRLSAYVALYRRVIAFEYTVVS